MIEFYTIYGRKDCRYCELAKALLTMRGKDWRYLDIDSVLMFRVEMMTKAPGSSTVPQVFINYGGADVHIGGYSDLQEYLK